LSENAEYSSAKEAQSFNEGRIFELEKIIKESVLIKPSRKVKKEKINRLKALYQTIARKFWILDYNFKIF